MIASEHHQRSPATRWYTQDQASKLYAAAGFTNIQMFKETTKEPAAAENIIFSVGDQAIGFWPFAPFIYQQPDKTLQRM